MAKAMVIAITQAYLNEGNTDIQFDTIFFGPDVAGGLIRLGLVVDIKNLTALTPLMNAMAAEVRNQATLNGFSVPPNQVFLPSFTTG